MIARGNIKQAVVNFINTNCPISHQYSTERFVLSKTDFDAEFSDSEIRSYFILKIRKVLAVKFVISYEEVNKEC